MRDNIADYEGLDAQILAVSVDSLFTLDKFKAEQNLNFPLLSDFNKEVSQAYGSFYSEFVLGMKGVSKRSAFVIDKKGVLQYVEMTDGKSLPDFQKIKNVLDGI